MSKTPTYDLNQVQVLDYETHDTAEDYLTESWKLRIDDTEYWYESWSAGVGQGSSWYDENYENAQPEVEFRLRVDGEVLDEDATYERFEATLRAAAELWQERYEEVIQPQVLKLKSEIFPYVPE